MVADLVEVIAGLFGSVGGDLECLIAFGVEANGLECLAEGLFEDEGSAEDGVYGIGDSASACAAECELGAVVVRDDGWNHIVEGPFGGPRGIGMFGICFEAGHSVSECESEPRHGDSGAEPISMCECERDGES